MSKTTWIYDRRDIISSRTQWLRCSIMLYKFRALQSENSMAESLKLCKYNTQQIGFHFCRAKFLVEAQLTMFDVCLILPATLIHFLPDKLFLHLVACIVHCLTWLLCIFSLRIIWLTVGQLVDHKRKWMIEMMWMLTQLNTDELGGERSNYRVWRQSGYFCRFHVHCLGYVLLPSSLVHRFSARYLAPYYSLQDVLHLWTLGITLCKYDQQIKVGITWYNNKLKSET